MLARSMTRPVPTTISIVGAGRVGATLGKRFRALGWRIGAVVTRTPVSARAAVRAIGAGSPGSMIAGAARRSRAGNRPFVDTLRAVLAADLVLIATPDSVMAAAVQSLAHAGGKAWRGKVVLHTSGALDRTVLAPLARLGASTGSLHPMQTFSGRGIPKLAGVTFAIEGDARARRVAVDLARSLGGAPVVIAGQDKPAYHAAAVLAAGSGFPLMEASLQMLMRIGFTRPRALQTLLPLTRQMLDNIERLGPRAAWTGPLSRGDYDVVAKHARALRHHPREFQGAYAALALLAGRTLAKNPKDAVESINRALKTSRRNRT
jgi:predicted short-subunit dehydrogenase-like oxidoreductase (DUF2520 family)